MIKEFLLENGASEVGYAFIDGYQSELLKEYAGAEKYKYAISVVVRLSGGALDGITDRPTHTYFQHYRTVNAFIDRLVLMAGMKIQKMGYDYIPVAASQSIGGYTGLFQHKTVARLAGLGGIGKSGLFISKKYGPRVRLGSILTNMPLECGVPFEEDLCGDCNICSTLCPAMAISGKSFSLDNPDDTLDRHACSTYMKEHFKDIGRGVVCGICIKNCPYGAK